MHPEYIAARDVTGQAFLWRARCARTRYVCTRWKLTPEDERRIESGIVNVDALTDRNPVHGNFSDVAGAFAFFADVPDKSLASFASTLLGRIGTIRSEQQFGTG